MIPNLSEFKVLDSNQALANCLCKSQIVHTLGFAETMRSLLHNLLSFVDNLLKIKSHFEITNHTKTDLSQIWPLFGLQARVC